jgi:diadenosine tetraphosphate (Ap4A) HIT family hydrolase
VGEPAWSDPAEWAELKAGRTCPICGRGSPLDVLAELPATWITGGSEAPLPGYACVVSKQHVAEPFELSARDAAAFWQDVMVTARVLDRLFAPVKLNYEIHGNTIPHLHLHVFPRFVGDPFEGGPIDVRKARFTRTEADLDRLTRALVAAA